MTTYTFNYREITALASVYAAAADTAKDTVAPILSGVRVGIAGGNAEAVASDRYIAARVRFPLAWDGQEDLAPVVLPGAWLGQLAGIVKRAGRAWHGDGSAAVVLTIDGDALTAQVTDGDGGQTLTAEALTGNYPPLERLFPAFDDASQGHPVELGSKYVLDVEKLARAAKLRHPADTLTGRGATAFGHFRFSATNESEYAALIATRRGGDVAALIQPNRASVYSEV